MIVKLLMDLLKAVILLVIGILPTLPDMSGLIQTISPVLDLIHKLNFIVDIRLLGICLSFLFIFTNIEFVWSIIMWVVRKIPGVS